jgi:hypothetical protein
VLALGADGGRVLKSLYYGCLSRVRAELVGLFDRFLVATGVAARGRDRGEHMATLIKIAHRNVSATKHQQNRDSDR